MVVEAVSISRWRKKCASAQNAKQAYSYYAIAFALDLLPHLWRNRMGVCWPRMTSWFSALRSDVSVPIAAAGFCWGGLHAIMLTHDRTDTRLPTGRPLIDASFVAHPSGISVPADIEKVKIPLSIAVGDDDFVMPLDQARQAKQMLEQSGDSQGEVIIYPGARHGFAVRASRSKPDSRETRQGEEAEEQAIAWFKKQFAALSKQ